MPFIKYQKKYLYLNTLKLRSYDGKIAVVKLAKHVFTGEKVAVKVIDKCSVFKAKYLNVPYLNKNTFLKRNVLKYIYFHTNLLNNGFKETVFGTNKDFNKKDSNKMQ